MDGAFCDLPDRPHPVSITGMNISSGSGEHTIPIPKDLLESLKRKASGEDSTRVCCVCTSDMNHVGDCWQCLACGIRVEDGR